MPNLLCISASVHEWQEAPSVHPLQRRWVHILKGCLCLHRNRTPPGEVNAVPAPDELGRDFSCARMGISMEVGYFLAREAKVKHPGYSVLEEFEDSCDFPSSFFQNLEALSSFPLQKNREVVYIHVKLVTSGTRTAFWDGSWSGHPISNARKRTSSYRTGIKEWQGIRQRQGCILNSQETILMVFVLEGRELLWMRGLEG